MIGNNLSRVVSPCSTRRILSLWFPRLAAERVLRAEPHLGDAPLAVVADRRGALLLASLTAAAEAAGLRRGMALGDARAICPGLVTRSRGCSCATPPSSPRCGAGPGASAPGSPRKAPRRWCSTSPAARSSSAARRRSPRRSGPRRRTSASRLRLGARRHPRRRLGGGALCRRRQPFPPMPATPSTRRRAPPARGRRSGAGNAAARRRRSRHCRRARPASCRRARPSPHIGPLPVAALRLEPAEVASACRRSASAASPSVAVAAAGAARPAGRAGGHAAARPGARPGCRSRSRRRGRRMFSRFRLTFPEPIGLEADVLAGIDRLLPPLCARLPPPARARGGCG